MVEDHDDQAVDEVRADLDRVEAAAARRHFDQFVRLAWRYVVREPLSWNWHHDMMADDLERFALARDDRLLYNVPPGTTKTTFFSIMFPAWVWTRASHTQFMLASHSSDRSEESALAVRDLVRTPWYRAHYGVTVREDQSLKSFFQNTAGGWVIATSTGGRATGEHPDITVIDDPHSAKRARSDADRLAAVRWYRETLSTRGLTKAMSMACVMQRLHEDDLSGEIVRSGGWKHVCLPMRYEPDMGLGDDPRPRPDPRDPRRKSGELLWPDRMPEEKVRAVARDLAAYGEAGQFQQRPSPEGGGLFRRDWLRVVSENAMPDGWRTGRVVRAWDAAGTEGAGCYTAGVKMRDRGAGETPRYVVEDVRRGQWSDADVDREMSRTAALDGRGCEIVEEQEPGSAGKAVVGARRRSFLGYSYDPVSPTGDKVTRARPLRSACEAGEVVLLAGAWCEDFIGEAEVFPVGRYKDQVDAAAHAFNRLVSGPRPMRVVNSGW